MDIHRDTILQIIDQQKNKMSSEQFWCVALLSGAFGALVLNKSDVSFLPSWLVILLSLLATVWGVVFVLDRHRNYRELQDTFARLVREETEIPPGWIKKPPRFGDNWFSYIVNQYLRGYGSYILIILALFVVVTIRYS